MKYKLQNSPAPWTLEDYGWGRKSDNGTPCFKGRIYTGAGEKDDTIHSGAAFGIFGKTVQEAEANAMLMAAAPDLLLACIQLIEAPHNEHFASRLNDEEMKGIIMIKAAIQKAVGHNTPTALDILESTKPDDFRAISERNKHQL